MSVSPSQLMTNKCPNLLRNTHSFLIVFMSLGKQKTFSELNISILIDGICSENSSLGM